MHALAVPAFEGPDEPFHLARVRALALGTPEDALDPLLISTLEARPCGPDMNAAFGCPPFNKESPSGFNLLRPEPILEGPRLEKYPNYQAHQPPLAYLLAYGVVRAGGTSPELQLLLIRLAAVVGMALALWVGLPRLERRHPGSEAVLLALLLLPGASESLIRVSNDAPIFFWALVVLIIVGRRPKATRAWLAVALLAVGPLLKLTALPVAAVVITQWIRDRSWRLVAAGVAATAAVFPVQLWRGWQWGGTLELNSSVVLTDSALVVAKGLAHSAYTFFKTAFWLGGWSGIRPPGWLVVFFAVLTLVLFFLARPRPSSGTIPHIAGLIVAAIGFVAFAVGKRKVFGVWGAVGGWYFWGWAPWVAVLLAQSFNPPPQWRRGLLVAAGLFAILSQILWVAYSVARYGL